MLDLKPIIVLLIMTVAVQVIAAFVAVRMEERWDQRKRSLHRSPESIQ